MVRADGAVKADVIESLYDLVQVKGTAAGEVRSLFEVQGLRIGIDELEVSDVCEVNPSLEGADHIRQIIVKVGAVGTRAEGDAVVRIVDHLHHAQDVLLAGDDAGQAEYGPCGIIGMDGHLDVVLIADGHDLLKEIFEVVEEIIGGHILILLEELLDVSHSLGLPAGHDGTVGVAGDGLEHLLGNQLVDGFLCVGQSGGSVRKDSCQLSSCPVEDRHEVVAHKVDVFFAKVLEGLDVVGDQLVAGRLAELDIFVNVDALDAGDVKAGGLNFFLERVDTLLTPHFTGLCVIKRCDDACHAGDLPDLLQGDSVEFGTVPSECHFHSELPLLYIIVVCCFIGFKKR